MTDNKLRILSAAAGILALTSAPIAYAQSHEGHDHASSPVTTTEAVAGTFSSEQILEFMGYMMASQMRLSEDFEPAEADALLKGMRIAANGEESPYDVQAIMPDVQAFMQAKEAESQARQAAEMEAAAAAEKQKGAAYLADIVAKDASIQKTDSGLHYKITAAGGEQHPTNEDQVTIHYEGTLIDGTVFDSSIQRGEPATFPISGVIPGFTEGLKLIGEGGKITLYIPSDLGYGDMGTGGPIGPGATLIFDVELIEITEPQESNETSDS